MTEDQPHEKAAVRRRRRRRRRRPAGSRTPQANPTENEAPEASVDGPSETVVAEGVEPGADKKRSRGRPREKSREKREDQIEVSGILEIRKDGNGFLRQFENYLMERKDDPGVPVSMVRKFGLRNGMLLAGRAWPGRGKQGPRLDYLETIDGMDLQERRKAPGFKKLTVIDPDFHYELGTAAHEHQLSMRILDLLSPIGRGQRGLLVAPPRTGKTTFLQGIAKSLQELYPDVHLMVLLIDERPEEATYWRRSVETGEVYVSTMDEKPKNHVRLAEMVQFRAERLVEQGKEVVILLDSITRLTRAYNNTVGGKNSKTMSGGLDSRVFQKPKAFFGSARNTESAGSLTILATALVDTGSRMDQVIFEEFKGTGNMEVTLDRALADRRVFPAINITATGTRKEEKLFTRQTMRKVNILRRVLSRMRPREAVEMLIDRLDMYPSNREFLEAFSLDDVD
ncbi:MAG: transcription termination factor Rho [Planctomycetes bacterium]|nr:transcription termination factor Rho [Planctomycetota bacterium]